MTVTVRPDHVIYAVEDLDAVIDAFEEQGFTVTRGGELGPLHNALIPFDDGTYLELLATRPTLAGWVAATVFRIGPVVRLLGRRQPLMTMAPAFVSARGLVMWAIRTTPIEEYVTAVDNEGISMGPIEEGGRTRPDGRTARWASARPFEPTLPFCIQDRTDMRLRIPTSEATEHANGVVGIETITVGVENLSRAVETYSVVFRTDPGRVTPTEAAYDLDGWTVRLRTADADADADGDVEDDDSADADDVSVSRRLREDGPGLAAITFARADGATGRVPTELAGRRLRISSDS